MSMPENTLLARLFDGSISAEDRAELDRLVSDNPEFGALVRDIERMTQQVPAGLTEGPTRAQVEEAWASFAARTGLSAAKSGREGAHPARIVRLVPRAWAVAASIVLLAATAWFLFGPGGADTPQWEKASTVRGQVATVSLPDGSTAVLNAESQLSWRFGGADAVRAVRLEGEAQFRVETGTRPFEVSTVEARIVALGTEFTVESRGGKTRVAVQEGRVAVVSGGGRAELGALEAAEVRASLAPKPLGSEWAAAADSWARGVLGFAQTPLIDVLDRVERRFDVQVVLEGAWSGEETLTGSFPGQNASGVLKTICRTFNCTVREGGGEGAQSYVLVKR
ncbi:MAG: hypothetical protein COV99_00420 [Bacteroidetes bacterium CG12_big_fil_rev_8_21_14_0_65_60_17]|nr:MAG: hypothetical protein COV99_00420 [Bacteroidetes bacterium CG12_big_fil_rev_8_21_14_0_65_60_17]